MIAFSDKVKAKIDKDFAETKALAESFSERKRADLFGIFERCDETEAYCVKFLYAYLPMTDLSNWSGEFFYNHVHTCVSNFGKFSWNENVDEETFLNFVLMPRVNNENLEHYNQIIFDELYPRIKDLSLYDAIVTVNLWCFERATYCGSDMRTVSPLTMMRNTNGRCGEESTFLTSSLRSVGIPARQCYVPRWAHSESNHAWVEVLYEGKWYYIGACEPEPSLNSGWFREPASRAMLSNTQIFSDIVSETNIASSKKHIKELNTLDFYARTKNVTIKLTDGKAPVVGARIRLSIINFNEPYYLFDLTTDSEGKVCCKTGKGDLLATITLGDKRLYTTIDVRTGDFFEIDFSAAKRTEEIGENEIFDFDLIPPDVDVVAPMTPVTEEYEKWHEAEREKAEKIRIDYKNTFCGENNKSYLCAKYPEFAAEIEEFTVNAQGNLKRIEAFLDDEKNIKNKVEFLKTLSKKDFGDCDNLILEKHFAHQMKYFDDFEDKELFFKNVAAIRIANEWLSDYAAQIENYFDEKTIEAFRKDPAKVMQYVNETVRDSEEIDYDSLTALPFGLLNTKCGNEHSRLVLAVAICRSLGIPAKCRLFDGTVEYFIDGEWRNLRTGADPESGKTATLELSYDDTPDIFRYLAFSKLKNGIFERFFPFFPGRSRPRRPGRTNSAGKPVPGGDMQFVPPSEIALEPGTYRIITNFRISNGGILGRMIHVTLGDGETKAVKIVVRTEQEAESKEKATVFDDTVYTADKKAVKLSELASGSTAFAWLETKLEPTEHVLNEMLSSIGEFKPKAKNICFILKNEAEGEHITFKKVINALPDIKIFYSEKPDDQVYRSLGTDDKRLPLVVVADGELKVSMFTTGYRIGTAEEILKRI